MVRLEEPSQVPLVLSCQVVKLSGIAGAVATMMSTIFNRKVELKLSSPVAAE